MREQSRDVLLTRTELSKFHEFLIEEKVKTRNLEIGRIDKIKWDSLVNDYKLQLCLTKNIVCAGNSVNNNQFKIEFIKSFGVPPSLCYFTVCPTETIVEYGMLLLFKELIMDICAKYPYEPNTVEHILGCLSRTYALSSRSFQHRYLKLDYEFILLRDYREFNRLQKYSYSDYRTPRGIPTYWFCPLDFGITLVINDETENELKEKLAIEDSWGESEPNETCSDSCNFILTYGFPAGAMFLKCKVEAQKTRSGGGIEYLYLGNEVDKVKYVESKKF